jgi:periplasmic divalent cation tolerance protein
MNPAADASTNGDERIVLSTASSRDEAHTIARILVERRLVACVNIVEGVHSVYRWQEKVEDEEEAILVIKTTEGRLAALEETIKALHSYELPEFVVLTVSGGSNSYLQWIRTSVR